MVLVPETEPQSVESSVRSIDFKESIRASVRWKDDDCSSFQGEESPTSNPNSSTRSTPHSSVRSNVSLSKHNNPSLHDNLMRERKRRNPHDYFEVIEVLGVGSMGSVSKVKKRDHAIGGSARPDYVDREHSFALEGCFNVPLIGGIFRACAGKIQEMKKQNLLKTPKRTNNSRELRKKHSSVIKYIHKDMYYALKSIHLDCISDPSFITELRNEVAILTTLDHPNIVKPLETFEYRNQLFILMELCSGGDLYTRDPYTEADAARIVHSILSAVAYMHSNSITHRDLKYENIVFSSDSPDSDIKIIDFGLSKIYDQDHMRDVVGTVYTMAPEVIKNNYTCQADMWSIGVLTFMLLSSSMPFYGKRRTHVIEKILKCKYSFKGRVWKRISPEAKQFVQSLLQMDPNARPTAEEASQSPWLSAHFDVAVEAEAQDIKMMDAVQATLQNFAEYGPLKKLALMVVAHKSTSEEIGFLRKIFSKYDKFKNGIISLPEFKQALEPYGYTDEEMETMFQGMDLDGTGIVHYTEFLAATIEAHGAITEERLAEAFDRLDCDDSGYITSENLIDFLGQGIPRDSIEQIISEADMNQDKRISYGEFLELWDDKYEEGRKACVLDVENRRLEHSPSSLIKLAELGHKRNNTASTELSVSSDEGEPGNFQFHAEKAKSIRFAFEAKEKAKGVRVFDM